MEEMNHLQTIFLKFSMLCVTSGPLVAQGAVAQATSAQPPMNSTETPNSEKVALSDGTVFPPGYLHAYSDFIDFLGMEDEDATTRAQEGKQARKRTDYSKSLYISTAEDEALHRILLDAYYKLKANDADAAEVERDIHKVHNPEPGLIAQREALHRARPQILLVALAELRRELSGDAMKRLDADIYCENPLPSPEQLRLHPESAVEDGSANCMEKKQP